MEKDKGSAWGSIPTAAPGTQRPQPRTVGPWGEKGVGRGEGEAVCAHPLHAHPCTHVALTKAARGLRAHRHHRSNAWGGTETPTPIPACVPPMATCASARCPPSGGRGRWGLRGPDMGKGTWMDLVMGGGCIWAQGWRCCGWEQSSGMSEKAQTKATQRQRSAGAAAEGPILWDTAGGSGGPHGSNHPHPRAGCRGCSRPNAPLPTLQALEELKMSGAASYEQLVRQVEALRRENSHLRRELQDNSQHLSKLENETSDMKVRWGPGGSVLWEGGTPAAASPYVCVCVCLGSAEAPAGQAGAGGAGDGVLGADGGAGTAERWVPHRGGGVGCGATHRAVLPSPSPSPALQMDISSLYSLKFPEVAVGVGEDSPQHSTPHGDSAGDVGRATLRLLEELDRER